MIDIENFGFSAEEYKTKDVPQAMWWLQCFSSVTSRRKVILQVVDISIILVSFTCRTGAGIPWIPKSGVFHPLISGGTKRSPSRF